MTTMILVILMVICSQQKRIAGFLEEEGLLVLLEIKQFQLQVLIQAHRLDSWMIISQIKWQLVRGSGV